MRKTPLHSQNWIALCRGAILILTKLMKGDAHINWLFAHMIMCKFKMEEYLRRLSDLILMEIGRKNQSCVCFAELCGISRNEMSDIINQKKKDLRLSTIFRICENSDIKLEDVFLRKKSEPQETYLLINGEKYLIELHKVRITPPEMKIGSIITFYYWDLN